MAGPFIDPMTGERFDEAEGAAGEEPVAQWSDQATEAPLRAGSAHEWGLTAEEASGLLHRKHGISIPSDDPILMMVTLHQRFLQDHQALLAAHDKAIEAAITSTAGSTVKAVNQALETLKDKTVLAGLNHAMELVTKQAVAMDRFERVTRRNLWVITGLNVASWLVFLVGGALLWSVLR